MKPPAKLTALFRVPVLTRTRLLLALVIAVLADGLQLLLNAAGWFGLDQAIDVAAMVATMWLLGFHVLLLPTFLLELVPVLEDLPTWTACVTAVIILRQREAKLPAAPPEPASRAPTKPVIDI